MAGQPPADNGRSDADQATGKGMLAGITVLDLSRVGPATRCARVLADYGADVVKVGAAPQSGGAPSHQLAHHAYSGSRGFRQTKVNLRSSEGVDVFLRLASGADVVLESFRPGVVDRLGIGYEAVRAVNSEIVYCSTSGYGQSGPHAQRAGHDLNYLGAGGFLHTSGRDDHDKPGLPGATVADIAAGGLHAATAIMAALVGRSQTGQGTYLDVSVTAGVAWMLSLYIDDYLATGELPGPGHNILTGRYACYGIYRTSDDRWLTVAAIEPVFWANLCGALDLDRWVDHQLDDDRQDEIRADLQAVFATADSATWVAKLADADTCVAAVKDIPEVVDDPQLVARGAVVAARHPSHGSFRQLGPLLAGALPQDIYDLPDTTRTDTAELLRAAGCSDDRIESLRNEGVIA